LGSAAANQDSVLEEVKSILITENACCHCVQHLLSYGLLSEHVGVEICKTLIACLAVYGYETLSLMLREECLRTGFCGGPGEPGGTGIKWDT
jgi:hypothetical protein